MLNLIEKPTRDPHLFRLVDEKGNWQFYVHYIREEQKGKKTYLRAVNSWLRWGYAKGPEFEKWLKNTPKEEIERRLTEAGDKGDHVHLLREALFYNGKITRETTIYDDKLKTEVTATHSEWEAMISLVNFINNHEAKWLSCEMPVYHLKKGYAGTADDLIILTKECTNRWCNCKKYIGKLGLFDLKSGGEWDEHGPQLAAYAATPTIVPYLKGLKLEYTANIYVGCDTIAGYKFVPYDAEETGIHQKEFLAAQTVANGHVKSFDPKVIVDTPDELIIENYKHE